MATGAAARSEGSGWEMLAFLPREPQGIKGTQQSARIDNYCMERIGGRTNLKELYVIVRHHLARPPQLTCPHAPRSKSPCKARAFREL